MSSDDQPRVDGRNKGKSALLAVSDDDLDAAVIVADLLSQYP
jgi:hypothetical protein